ncbi:MAG: adenosine deaminase [Spirochaetales bacterium]|nr:adenosine deaminase [Spirochaetales bacterium]
MVTKEIIKRIPKVELHDHLDGGLRPSTIIELAEELNAGGQTGKSSRGEVMEGSWKADQPREPHEAWEARETREEAPIELPAWEAQELADWFHRGARQKDLSLYLETFGIALSVLQTPEALERVAFESMEDLAADHVVYAEIRFAPMLHQQRGMNLEAVVQSVLKGLERGRKKTGTMYGLILCAMRHQDPKVSLDIAELAVAFRDRGVVGFDIAGDEVGHPPKRHLEAFQYIRNRNFNITIHAGEAFGLESIWQAVQICGAHRIGHGTRLIEDMGFRGTHIERMGSLAHFIRDKRIPLEMCLSSNIDTGAAENIDEHPFNIFYKNNFRVSLCTDNRLMSSTTLSHEMMLAVRHFNLEIQDLEKISINAMKSSFIHHDEKIRIIYDVIKREFAALKRELASDEH